MIQIGCCGSLEQAEAIKNAGFAYLEANISQLCAMDEHTFEQALARQRSLGLPVPAANCFLPGDWPLGHAEADPRRDRAYLELAAGRLSRMGCRTAVLGSGGARALSPEFGEDRGRDQFMAFYRLALQVLGEKGIIVAIEPLRRAECNWLNSVAESAELIRSLPEENKGVICDFYHLAQEDEPLEHVTEAGALLRHCHIAHPVTRYAPTAGDGVDYGVYMNVLKALDYHGTVSFEGNWENDPALLERCADCLRQAAGA